MVNDRSGPDLFWSGLLQTHQKEIPMSRSRRNVLPGYAHHVYQRGVRKEPLFHEDRDFLVYMRALKEGCVRHGVSIRTYTMMTNHIHLIAVPKSEDSLSRALHLAHTDYTMYFNAKYRFTGHAFERRPEMCAMDEIYMWKAIRYVERNPVRARMVIRAEDYLWSSAAAHCGFREDVLIDGEFPPPGAIENWSSGFKFLTPKKRDANSACTHLAGARGALPSF